MKQGSTISKKTKQQVIIVTDSNDTLEEIVIKDTRTNTKPVKVRFEDGHKDTVINIPCPGTNSNRHEVINNFFIHNSDKIMLPIVLDATWIAINIGSEKMIALKDTNILWGRMYNRPGNYDTIQLLYYCVGMHSHYTLATIDTKTDNVTVRKYDREPVMESSEIHYDAIHYKYFAESIEYVPVCHDTIIVGKKIYRINV